MSRKHQSSAADVENPEWTDEDFASAIPFPSLPPALKDKLQGLRRGRPPAAVTKERITIRLSADVLAAFRASGPGWQTRMDAALLEWLKKHSPHDLPNKQE